MKDKTPLQKSHEHLHKEIEELRNQLEEANETIDAIRTGQIDALVVQGTNGHQLYTLKTADHTYRLFIEKMTEGAVTLNENGVILYCNSQFARMVHLPLSGVLGLQFEQFVAPKNKQQYRRLFKRSWKTDSKEEVMLVSAAQFMPVQLSLTSLELDEGVSLSIIITDLTTLKAAQEQLKQNNQQLEEINQALEASNHDLQQFASVASHDLQEPLRKVQIFSNLIKESGRDLTPTLKAYLDKIIVSSARMKTLIIDILNYSRLSANDHPVEYVDFNELLVELLEDFEMMIQDKNATITYSPLPFLHVNRGQIRQVFQNIISNAMKFSRPGVPPVIRIASKRLREKSFESNESPDGGYCLITITDNGIGFDEKYVAKIFTLFERLNSKDKYEGTGIGMAIAKKIMDKHNGAITAVSQEGAGTTFKIILPYR